MHPGHFKPSRIWSSMVWKNQAVALSARPDSAFNMSQGYGANFPSQAYRIDNKYTKRMTLVLLSCNSQHYVMIISYHAMRRRCSMWHQARRPRWCWKVAQNYPMRCQPLCMGAPIHPAEMVAADRRPHATATRLAFLSASLYRRTWFIQGSLLL